MSYFNLNEISHSFLSLSIGVLQVGEILTFEDILFESGKTTLLPGYEHAPERLLKLINYAENYRFEIQGHVSRPTIIRGKFKEDYLADARAEKIFDFLIQNDIDSNRLEWKGYGNWYIIFPNPQSEAQARLNRRVSVKVLGRIDD